MAARKKKVVVKAVHEADTVYVYTDGSCSYKIGAGGWAFVAVFNDTKARRYGHKGGTTNNEMEMRAICRALKFVPLGPEPFRLYTDSEYCQKALMLWWPGWEKQAWHTSTGTPVKNVALIRRTVKLIEGHKQMRDFRLCHIKGHAGHEYNEEADRLAGEARKSKLTKWP